MIDETIKKLTEDLEPVKPLKHPLVRLAPWAFVAIIYTFGIISWLGIRHDMPDKMDEKGYVFELAVALIASIAAAISALYASVPDMRGQKWILIIPLSLTGILGAWLGYRVGQEGISYWTFDIFHHCVIESLLLGLVPTAFLVAMVKRGASTQPILAVLSVILSTSLMSWAAMRITCSIDDMGHSCMTHIIPYIAVGALLGLFSQKLLKW